MTQHALIRLLLSLSLLLAPASALPQASPAQAAEGSAQTKSQPQTKSQAPDKRQETKTKAESPTKPLPTPDEQSSWLTLPETSAMGSTIQRPPSEATGWSLGLTMAGISGIWASMFVFAYFAWYKDLPEAPFRWNNDGWFGQETYAGGADKLGHFWSNYMFQRGVSAILRFGGWHPAVATAVSASWNFAYFLFVEYKDAFYFAFSSRDLAMNLAGQALGILMDHIPILDDAIDFKVEYWPSDGYRETFRDEGNVNIAEDYTGQRYLLNFHLSSIRPLAEHPYLFWTRYADLALGFRAWNYKPTPKTVNDVRSQAVFLGLTLNLQQVLDDLIFRHVEDRGTNFFYMASRIVNEFYAFPYTTVRYPTWQRSIAW